MFKFSFLFAALAFLTSGCAMISGSYIPVNSDVPFFETKQSLKEAVEESKQLVADSKQLVEELLKLIEEGKKIPEELLPLLEEGKKIPEELLPLLEEVKENEVVHEVYLKLMANGALEQFDIIK